MKVLHVFNALEFSGAEVMYVQAAPFFQKKECELVALSTANHLGAYVENFKKVGYKIEHKPFILSRKSIFGFISSLVWLFNYVKSENVDVVHIHRSKNYWWIALSSVLAGAGVIRTVHNVFRNRWFTRPKAILERWSARVLLGVIFHSIGESVYNNEKKYYKNESTKVNNWFDSTKFFPVINEEEKRMARRELDLMDGAFIVISVGGCSYVKRHEDIIEAVSLISKSKNIVYLHLGDGVTRSCEEQKVKELNISDKVVFVGNTNEVRKYLIASDVFLMPSRFEGLGNSALEAMACGIPLILYDVPGLRDLIHENDAGLLIKEDVNELVNAITYFLDCSHLEQAPNKKLECSNKGLAGVKVANEQFSIQNGVEGIVGIYRKVI